MKVGWSETAVFIPSFMRTSQQVLVILTAMTQSQNEQKNRMGNRVLKLEQVLVDLQTWEEIIHRQDAM
jgi:hypothetical protein